jgi:hypothetical protein
MSARLRHQSSVTPSVSPSLLAISSAWSWSRHSMVISRTDCRRVRLTVSMSPISPPASAMAVAMRAIWPCLCACRIR